jgi:linoleate 10R-lipoxygenase
MLTKLLFRHLPDHYPVRSTYAHFPFLVPEKMREAAHDHSSNVESKYEWNRPPVPVGPTIPATKYSDVQQLLSNPAIFHSGVAERLDILTGGVHLNIAPVSLPVGVIVLAKLRFLEGRGDSHQKSGAGESGKCI